MMSRAFCARTHPARGGLNRRKANSSLGEWFAGAGLKAFRGCEEK
jgi:hypothetical protein